MIYEQFAKPSGIFGKLAGQFMARENNHLNDWTQSFLSIEEGDRVLEVGFGPGDGLVKAACVKGVTIYGVDPSETMVETVLKKLRKYENPNQIGIFHGEAHDLSRFQHSLDKVYAVNNVSFWHAPVETLSHIRSLIRSNGRIALTLLPHEKGADDDTTEVLGGQLRSMLIKAGFSEVQVHFKDENPNKAVCVVGMA
ncbi:class I SAM-dependent methyltransferase [Halobacillus litoralis]|uniref:class I SAM-dependent methyltransferase n=1 Tax=Halobacillus litoralis TaxID=45668 RepID=UPI001CFD68B8|nr:methyltransferase domain-containing protein [Halobacillus litoralis]